MLINNVGEHLTSSQNYETLNWHGSCNSYNHNTPRIRVSVAARRTTDVGRSTEVDGRRALFELFIVSTLHKSVSQTRKKIKEHFCLYKPIRQHFRDVVFALSSRS
ncbi:unnamed protein product [Ixodes persulcatus]